jgi:hypothetical protein
MQSSTYVSALLLHILCHLKADVKTLPNIESRGYPTHQHELLPEMCRQVISVVILVQFTLVLQQADLGTAYWRNQTVVICDQSAAH